MARESQELQVKRWVDRITTSRKWKDRKVKEYGWDRFIRQYKGDYDVVLGSNERRFKAPAINTVFANVQTDIAFIYFKDPYITLRPTKSSSVKSAAILEAAVNYYWRFLDQKTEQESQLLDANLVGHAWNKDGYFVKTAKRGDAESVYDEGMYSMKVSWRDIFFNIGSRRPPNDCLWLAHRIIKPLDEVRQTFSGLDDLPGITHPHLLEEDIRDSVFKDDIDFCVLYEIWDAQKREVSLIAEGHPTFLKKPTPWPEYYKELPFSKLWWYENPDEPYPLSPMSVIENQNLEEIKLFAQALNHVKRFNRQMLYKGNLMTEENEDKFEQGNDGAMIRVECQGSIQDATKMVDYGPLPTDIYVLLDRIRQYRDTVSGQPQFQQGAAAKTGTRTLGELEQIAAGAKTRLDKRVDRLETHVETIARHMIGHMQENFDTEKIVKITGATPKEIIQAFGDAYDPETQTIRFSREDIQGEYDIEVRAGSTLPMTRESRIATLKEVLELSLKTGGNIPTFAKVIVQELLRDYQLPQLQEAFDQEQMQAEIAAQKQGGELSIQAAKTAAETEKRAAQAHQINLESALLEAQLQMPTRLMSDHENGVSPQEAQLVGAVQ